MNFLNKSILSLFLITALLSNSADAANRIRFTSGIITDFSTGLSVTAPGFNDIIGHIQKSLTISGDVAGSIMVTLIDAAGVDIATARNKLSSLAALNGEAGILFLDATSGSESAMGSADKSHLHYNLAVGTGTVYMLEIRISGFWPNTSSVQWNDDSAVPFATLINSAGIGGFVKYKLNMVAVP